ncbi:MAG: radical SAM protein [Candidatus Altiarchaeia archaeon]
MDNELKALIADAALIHKRNFGRRINFCHTGDAFPAFSLTGSSCALSCKHCKRKLIERLPPVTTPQALKKACLEARSRGAKGALLTGGCTKDAKVPIRGFLPVIKEIKEETGMILIAHTGLSDEREALEIKEAGIDGVCLDVVGSQETTEEIYGVKITPEMYRATLIAYEKAGIRNISPHVCVGLHHGRILHELSALDNISCIKPGNIVLTGLTDQEGTPMQGEKIDPCDYIRVLCHARKKFPNTYLSLGCARGKGEIRSEIDRMAVSAGVNNIAVPTKAAYGEAERLGLEIKEYSACCSLLPEQLT